MKHYLTKDNLRELRSFLILWATQALSSLGSAMTSFALIVWSYDQQGSALSTALLSVCSYLPYVAMSIFAGALSDRWNKKRTMLVCDCIAAATTLCVLLLLVTDRLTIGHLYAINAVNGLMNTVQRPAADVTVTLLTPKHLYQQTAALQSFSGSLINIITPALASALLAFTGLRGVILVDLLTFAAAFLSLLLLVEIPEAEDKAVKGEPLLRAAGEGLAYLRRNRGVLHMILSFAAINLVASMYEAALPAMILSVPGGGQAALGTVNAAKGIAMLAGSSLALLLPKPRSRVTMVVLCMAVSMSTDNFLLAFGRSLPWWCLGAVLGWLPIPLMNANLTALMRGYIPVGMQGRVFSARNTLQFFTIPVGYALGGWLVDRVFEPAMAAVQAGSLPALLFGTGKGSGAAALFAVLGACGVAVCMAMATDQRIREMERT
ncbi:MAG: MFS transporter [Clostridia bacterium]|nr:MFS transporter [Clostridia bacterium]